MLSWPPTVHIFIAATPADMSIRHAIHPSLDAPASSLMRVSVLSIASSIRGDEP